MALDVIQRFILIVVDIILKILKLLRLMLIVIPALDVFILRQDVRKMIIQDMKNVVQPVRCTNHTRVMTAMPLSLSHWMDNNLLPVNHMRRTTLKTIIRQ